MHFTVLRDNKAIGFDAIQIYRVLKTTLICFNFMNFFTGAFDTSKKKK